MHCFAFESSGCFFYFNEGIVQDRMDEDGPYFLFHIEFGENSTIYYGPWVHRQRYVRFLH